MTETDLKDLRDLLDILDLLHGRSLRGTDDTARLLVEHDALPGLVAAIRAVLDKCDAMESEAAVGRFIAAEFRRVVFAAIDTMPKVAP